MKSKTLVGYGLKFSGGNYLSAGTYHIDNNGQTVKTGGFGYILGELILDLCLFVPFFLAFFDLLISLGQ